MMIDLGYSRTLPIGLHLGARSATLVQLAGNSPELRLREFAHGELPFEEQLSAEEQIGNRAAALQRLIADHQFKGKQVVSCLGSQELFVQNVRLPQLPPEEMAKVVRSEAEERLPYPVADAEIRHLLAGQVRQDASVKQEVILMACQRDVIRRHIELLEQAGLVPVAIDVEPCAVLRSLQLGEQLHSDVEGRQAYLTLGERATTIIFAEGDQVLFLKYIAYGGYHLDQAVARHLDLSLDEAAKMRAMVTESPELDAYDDLHRSVIEAIRHLLESISSEIEMCLRYYKVTFRGRPLEKLFLAGSEATPWLLEFFSSRLGTTCEMADPMKIFTHQPEGGLVHHRPWRWTTALGLSMKTCC